MYESWNSNSTTGNSLLRFWEDDWYPGWTKATENLESHPLKSQSLKILDDTPPPLLKMHTENSLVVNVHRVDSGNGCSQTLMAARKLTLSSALACCCYVGRIWGWWGKNGGRKVLLNGMKVRIPCPSGYSDAVFIPGQTHWRSGLLDQTFYITRMVSTLHEMGLILWFISWTPLHDKGQK